MQYYELELRPLTYVSKKYIITQLCAGKCSTSIKSGPFGVKLNTMAAVSFAGGEWAWVVIIGIIAVAGLFCVFSMEDKGNKLSVLVIFASAILLGAVVVHIMAGNRSSTLAAKSDLREAGFKDPKPNVSRGIATVSNDECSLGVSMVVRDNNYIVVIKKNNGSNIVVTPEKLDQICKE